MEESFNRPQNHGCADSTIHLKVAPSQIDDNNFGSKCLDLPKNDSDVYKDSIGLDNKPQMSHQDSTTMEFKIVVVDNTRNNDFFTCISCNMRFTDREERKLHFGTLWHRYNLLRRTRNLRPITFEKFNEFHQLILEKEKNEIEQSPRYCVVCKKSFGTSKSYDNHLNSKKHREKTKNDEGQIKAPVVKRSEDDAVILKPSSSDELDQSEKYVVTVTNIDDDNDDSDQWEDCSSDDDNPIQCTVCMFCLHDSNNLFTNIEHMTTIHSFFIPDIEYCVDLNGLILYLAEKVSEGFMCLWCSGKGKRFRSADAVRNHMKDKGHTKMIYDDNHWEEYIDFYDFSSSYSDVNDNTVDVEDEINPVELIDTGFELTLPSGSKIGHRSLLRYYKQNLRPIEAFAKSKKSIAYRLPITYRFFRNSTLVAAHNMAARRNIKYRNWIKSKYSLKLGLKANKLQTYFRHQVRF